MGKGLGAVLAEGKAWLDHAGVKSAPDCPLCGHPMELEMGGWFCRSEREERHGHGRPCFYHKESELIDAFLHDETATERRWADDWQGATLAAIVEDGQMVVELHTIRGGGGRTNLRLTSGVSDKDLPEYCKNKKCTRSRWYHPQSESKTLESESKFWSVPMAMALASVSKKNSLSKSG